MTFERLRPASHNEIPDELSVLHIRSEAFSHELHSRYCFDSPWPLFSVCSWNIPTKTGPGPRTSATLHTRGECRHIEVEGHVPKSTRAEVFFFSCVRYSSGNMDADGLTCSVAPQYWTWGNHMKGTVWEKDLQVSEGGISLHQLRD